MGKRGPIAQPIAVLKQKGTINITRAKDVKEIDQKLDFIYNSIPSPPDRMSDLGCEIWNSMLMQASKMYGYISFIDLKLFEEYCECWSELQSLNNKCRGNSISYEDKNGVKRINPIYKERDDKRKLFIRLSQEFGFSPSARTRIKLEQQKEEVQEPEYEL